MLLDEITALEKRQKTVQCAMVSITTNADTLSEQAEAQNDMTLIMKSNAFRRSAKEKDEEHASLAKKICETLWGHANVIKFQSAATFSTANFIQRKLLIL